MKGLFIIFILHIFIIQAIAQIKTEMIEYTQGDSIPTKLEGYLAYDRLLKSKRPGILLIHEQWGQDDFIRTRANELANLGYVIFAIDMYGKGVLAEDIDQAEDLMEPFYGDLKLMRERAKAGLQILRQNKKIDPTKIGVLGYGFGGTVALELARAGEDLKCAVGFHCHLNTDNPSDANNIRGTVLIFQGANDPNISTEEVSLFQDEMRKAEVDWEMIIYGNAVYGFTNKVFGFEVDDGIAYNYKAEKRSTKVVKNFLEEIFR